jgi:hypothetical protein
VTKYQHDEANKSLGNYRRAIEQMEQILTPSQLEQILKRMSREPEPSEVFDINVIPSLNNLWLEARLARERYIACLANEVLMTLPKIVDRHNDAA